MPTKEPNHVVMSIIGDEAARPIQKEGRFYLGSSNFELLTKNRPRPKPIRIRYLGHVTGYQPIRDQYFLNWSVHIYNEPTYQEPTGLSKQPIKTRYLGHVTGYGQRGALGKADRLEQTSSMLCAPFGHNLGVNIWPIMDVNPYKSGLGLTSIIDQMLTPKLWPNGAHNIDDVCSNRSALPSAFILRIPQKTPQKTRRPPPLALSANKGPVFPDSVGSCYLPIQIGIALTIPETNGAVSLEYTKKSCDNSAVPLILLQSDPDLPGSLMEAILPGKSG
eukprot:sb/3468030/